MIRKNNKKGFTLIELLVVISIIGLLSSVVLTSLSSARLRASDANIRQMLSQARGAAELIYSSTGTYDTVCNAASETGKLYLASYNLSTKVANTGRCVSSSVAANQCLDDAGVITCVVNGGTPGGTIQNKWAMTVQLKGVSRYFCVDSTGFVGETVSRMVDTNGADPVCGS